ncbi:hypothetical protein BZA70DRAFT_279910 [Myxozyma melibiosi]|uniref:Mannosyl transferase n=1 Tax=Myxozyma melibiosi TaxID=54550 RepID=A0ABR1F4H2_9ASCO
MAEALAKITHYLKLADQQLDKVILYVQTSSQQATDFAQQYLANATKREYILILAGVIILLQVVLISVKLVDVFRATSQAPAVKNASEKKKADSKAVWTPVEFKTPTPPPYPNWDIKTTKPISYRPFKHNYHVTMGIRNLNWEDWIELDNEFPKFHDRKVERLAERGEKLVSTFPDAFDAAVELLEEFREWLPARYPSLFKKTAVGIDNIVTGESFNIKERPLKRDPMEIAALLIQDDLAIMMPGEDGQYYLKAGCILLAGFWRLSDKLGMPLSEIHTSGDVPQFREKLQTSMERFFVRMKVDKPVSRNNYFLQTDEDLGWSAAIGPEDSDNIGWNAAAYASDISKMHFRSERQTLRRLPKSGGIVFTIRTYFVPLTELAKEPYLPGRLADGMRAWTHDVAEYKGKAKYAEITLKFLDEEHQRQLANGLDPSKEPNDYPY